MAEGTLVRSEQFQRLMKQVASAVADLLAERNEELYSKVGRLIESAGFDNVSDLFDENGAVKKNVHVDAVTYTVGVVALTDFYIKQLERQGPVESKVDWQEDVEYSQLVDDISDGLREIRL